MVDESAAFASGTQDDHFFQDRLEMKIFPEDSVV